MNERPGKDTPISADDESLVSASVSNGASGGRMPGSTPEDGGPTKPRDDGYGAGITTFHAFRYREFRWLWLGSTFSGAAQWIQQTTMGWVVYDITGSGALLGLVNSVRQLPSLLVFPIAGVASDRMSRTVLVIVTEFALFLNALFIALMIAFGLLEVWHLFAFALLAGILNALVQPARQTMVFDVVPREVVPNAVGLNNIAQSVSRSFGPMVAGGLIVFLGPSNNFMVQALAYLGVIGTIFMMRYFPPRNAATAKGEFFKDVHEGYSYAIKNRQMRLLLLMMILYPLFIVPIHNGMLPIFAKEVFHTGAGGLGIMLSAIGIGGVIGGMITASANRVDRRGLLQLYALYVCCGSMTAFAILGSLTGSLPIGVVLLAMSGAGGALFNATNQTVVQLLAPDHMRGRITSILHIQPIFTASGAMIGGSLADLVGPTAVVATSGLLGCFVGLAILAFSPRMRGLRLSRLSEEQTARRAAAAAH